jgi:hypothetical protein
MLSYATIDRIEGDYAVCEVEQVPCTDARVDDYICISCFFTDVPKTLFTFKGLPIKEGNVYAVLHNGETVEEVKNIDEAEKKRRINVLANLM